MKSNKMQKTAKERCDIYEEVLERAISVREKLRLKKVSPFYTSFFVCNEIFYTCQQSCHKNTFPELYMFKEPWRDKAFLSKGLNLTVKEMDMKIAVLSFCIAMCEESLVVPGEKLAERWNKKFAKLARKKRNEMLDR